MTKLKTGRHTQAIKASRQNDARNLRNKAFKSRAKTQVRKVVEAVNSGNFDEAKSFFPTAVSSVDKAVKKGGFHKKKAARLKSTMARKINQQKTQK